MKSTGTRHNIGERQRFSAYVAVAVMLVACPVFAESIYWTATRTPVGDDRVFRAALDGSGAQVILDGGAAMDVSPIFIGLHPTAGKIYASSGNDKIFRMNLDGSDVEVLISSGLGNPADIAVDQFNKKLYWTDNGSDIIWRSNLDGSALQSVVTTGLDYPEGLALDLTDGKLYWTDRGHNRIQRADLDGSNIEDVLPTGSGNPVDVSLDVAAGHIYWTDAGGSIGRANLDGSGAQTLLTGYAFPAGIAVDTVNGKLYWSDYSDDKIFRANLDGSAPVAIVTSGFRNAPDIDLALTTQVVIPLPAAFNTGLSLLVAVGLVLLRRSYTRAAL